MKTIRCYEVIHDDQDNLLSKTLIGTMQVDGNIITNIDFDAKGWSIGQVGPISDELYFSKLENPS